MRRSCTDRHRPRARKLSTLPTVVRAELVGACIAIGGVAYTYLTTGAGIWIPQSQTDHLSDTEFQRRERAFASLGPLPLQVVPIADVSTAVDGMRLTNAEREALLAAVAPTPIQPKASQTPQATGELSAPKPPAEAAQASIPNGCTRHRRRALTKACYVWPGSPSGIPMCRTAT
jgi:hypothetical protein